MKRVTWLVSLIALAGCSIVTSLDGYTFGEDDDAGAMDGSVDAGDRDAGGDANEAGADAGGGCATDCSPGYCFEPRGECAECLEHDHCDPATPRCDTNDGAEPGTCGACMNDHYPCQNRVDLPLCDETSGACVECTPATELVTCAGAGMACHPGALECNGLPFNSLPPCGVCRSDNECGPHASNAETVCLIDPYGLGVDTGHCAIDLASYRAQVGATEPCPDGYPAEVTGSTSLGSWGTFCLPDASVTTCTAHLHQDMTRTCAFDGDCGEPTFATDGVCSGAACQIACDSDGDCPGGSCNLTSSPSFCG